MTITEACEIIEAKALSLTDGWVITPRDYNKHDHIYDIRRYTHPQLPGVELIFRAPVGKPAFAQLLHKKSDTFISVGANAANVEALVRICKAANRAHDENELKLRHAPIITLAEKLSTP